jgi:hypothetical protein
MLKHSINSALWMTLLFSKKTYGANCPIENISPETILSGPIPIRYFSTGIKPFKIPICKINETSFGFVYTTNNHSIYYGGTYDVYTWNQLSSPFEIASSSVAGYRNVQCLVTPNLLTFDYEKSENISDTSSPWKVESVQYDYNSTPVSPPIRIDDDGRSDWQYDLVLIKINNEILRAWTYGLGHDILGRKSTLTNQFIGTTFRINAIVDGNQSVVDILGLKDSYVSCWVTDTIHSSHDIECALSKIDNPSYAIKHHTINNVEKDNLNIILANIADFDDGKFIIPWQANIINTSNAHIYSTILNTDLSSHSDAFAIKTNVSKFSYPESVGLVNKTAAISYSSGGYVFISLIRSSGKFICSDYPVSQSAGSKYQSMAAMGKKSALFLYTRDGNVSETSYVIARRMDFSSFESPKSPARKKLTPKERINTTATDIGIGVAAAVAAGLAAVGIFETRRRCMNVKFETPEKHLIPRK